MKHKIYKQLDKLEHMLTTIDEYNAYLNDNTYYDHGKMLSFDVKMHNAYIPSGAVEDYLKILNVSPEIAQAVKEEFNDNRLEGVGNHWLEDMQESFISFAGDEDSPYYNVIPDIKPVGFYGRSGGHLCLGKVSDFEIDTRDTEIRDYPIWNWSKEDGTFWVINGSIIEDLKEYFEVTTQKEVYRLLSADLKGDIKYYYDKAIANRKVLEDLESQIELTKQGAKDSLIYALHWEIDRFIGDGLSVEVIVELAEAGDMSRIDSIKTIGAKDIITTRNAKVPTREATRMLIAICQGKNVVGKHVGAYTINDVIKKEKDSYVKIGCHVFSLAQSVDALLQGKMI